jgi:hypothetical protein
MRISVFTFDSNPAVDSPLYHISRRRAEDELQRGISVRIAPHAIQRRPLDQGRGAVIPLTKRLNKLQRPPRINYPIPAVADHRKRWHSAFLNRTEATPSTHK